MTKIYLGILEKIFPNKMVFLIWQFEVRKSSNTVQMKFQF